MTDNTTSIQHLKKLAQEFVREREWAQFHNPKNLSMNLAVEAAELMEKFLWVTTQESHDQMLKNRQEIQDEVADILLSILCFANTANIDLSESFERKLKITKKKYPVEKSKGKSHKYTKL